MIILSDDDTQKPQHLSASFAGLMDVYECNYIGIRRLIPVMPGSEICLISKVPGGLDLYLEVVECFRYTTELSLTYHFFRNSITVAEPDLRVRVYHDARQAEVMSAQLRNWPNMQAMVERENIGLYSRWHVNRFLNKWLHYCLRQGHRFVHPDRKGLWESIVD